MPISHRFAVLANEDSVLFSAIMVMGICSSFIVKDWKAALEPYDLNDFLLLSDLCGGSAWCSGSAGRAIENRNDAYANLLKSRSFPVLIAQSVNTERSQVQVASAQGLASNTRNSVEEHTTGTAIALSDARSEGLVASWLSTPREGG